MKNRIVVVFTAVILFFVQSAAFSAEFSTFKNALDGGGLHAKWGDGLTDVLIHGEIVHGDYEKFQLFLLTSDNLWSYLNGVVLSSPGGDVVEALKFANLFEKSYADVWVIGGSEMAVSGCSSSCFIMYAGGVERHITAGELGVHRISLRELQPDIQKAKVLISPLATDISTYLSQQGIPRLIIDKMNETPASDIYKIDHWTLNDMGLGQAMKYNPIFIDLVDKTCGRNPDPFPGKFTNERPALDNHTTQLLSEWVKCKEKLKNKNRGRFLGEEVAALKIGKPTIIFPKNSVSEVKQIFNARFGDKWPW